MKILKINIKKKVFLILSAALTLIMIFAPVPYVIDVPGPTYNTLDKKILNIKNYNEKISGQLRFLTVSIYGVEKNLPLYFAAFEYFNKNARVLPAEAVLEKNLSIEKQKKVFEKQMSNSQQNASNAAKKYLKIKKMPKIVIDDQGSGGPSAGLMFTLAIISRIENKTLTGNNIVAGTGTIDKNGKVGSIGGVRQKIISAVNDGAKYFLVPNDNCAELKNHTPLKIKSFNVNNLTDALNVLEKIKNNKINELTTYKCS
jgi:PDZ domain-containing protein